MKYWAPDFEHIEKLAKEVSARNPKLVIDVGGNDKFRFPAANQTVGFEGDIHCDLSVDQLPFGDKEVDFLFCRHTIEDLSCPKRLLSEIRRVAKAGYIETPSALVEVTRGVDAYGNHMGYVHHRWICYNNDGVFTAIAKYPVLETLQIDGFKRVIEPIQRLWNFRFPFNGDLQYRVLENESGFHLGDVDEFGGRAQYEKELNNAICAALYFTRS